MAKFVNIDGLKPIKVFLSAYAEEPILVYKKEDIDRRITENSESEVHGHWIHVAGMNSRCSVCERYFPVSEFMKRPFDIKFCPNCGARMDEEEQNE